MNSPIMYETISTPHNKVNIVTNLSEVFLGVKSPKPTVVSDVQAKYTIISV